MKKRSYRGSQIVQFRLEDELLSSIYEQVRRSITNAREEPYTVSSWIRAAIKEKLSHLKRSSRPRKATYTTHEASNL